MKKELWIICPLLCVGLAHLVFTLIVRDAYYIWPWLDEIMHTSGGVGAGLIAAYLVGPLTWRHALAALGAVALVGIAWEWFEFLIDAIFDTRNQPSVSDTMSDLFLDLVGGGAGAALVYAYFARNRGR